MDAPDRVYVWAWLPGATEPVPAGMLRREEEIIWFHYGRTYIERPDAIPLYLPELPLRSGPIRPLGALTVAGCIRDAGPDAWGQRLILARHVGPLDRSSDTVDLDLLTYLLESGSDRLGALAFQADPREYIPRTGTATLEEVQSAAERFLAGEELSPELDAALFRGTSIGGARPKVVLRSGTDEVIAKLSVASDPYPVVKAEGVAMNLAARAGLDVASSGRHMQPSGCRHHRQLGGRRRSGRPHLGRTAGPVGTADPQPGHPLHRLSRRTEVCVRPPVTLRRSPA